jgi:hypothetical protein
VAAVEPAAAPRTRSRTAAAQPAPEPVAATAPEPVAAPTPEPVVTPAETPATDKPKKRLISRLLGE